MFINNKNTKGGFTLIELMVAIALMIILTGAVVQIFSTSSSVFNRAEARISIYQNARAALQKIGTEIAGAFPYFTDNGDTTQWFQIDNMDTTTAAIMWNGINVNNNARPQWRNFNAQDVLTFLTTTSWMDDNDTTGSKYRVGAAKVVYSTALDGTRYILRRELYQALVDSSKTQISGGGGGLDLRNDLCQYLARVGNNCRLAVEYQNSPTDTFHDGDRAEANKSLPTALRVTMDVTDDIGREFRTISRTIWIPTSTQ